MGLVFQFSILEIGKSSFTALDGVEESKCAFA